MATNGLLEAVIGLLVAIVTGMTFLLRRQLGKIDASVNHKHKHNREETLYDLQHTQTLLLEKLSEDMDDLICENRGDHEELTGQVKSLDEKLTQHRLDKKIHIQKEI